MSKEKRSAIGDLTTLLKSRIIWDLTGRNPALLAKEAGEPCYSYAQEEHASNFPFMNHNWAHLEVSWPHEYEYLSSLRGSSNTVSLDAFSDAFIRRLPTRSNHFPSPLAMLPC